MKTTIPRHTKECLYDFIDLDDKVTISAFILSGSTLKGTLTLVGPLPGLADATASTVEVYETVQKLLDLGSSSNDLMPLTYSQVINWELLFADETMTESEDEDEEDEEEDEEEEDGNSEQAKARRHAKQKAFKQRQAARYDKRRARMLAFQRKQQAVAKSAGEPVQYTTTVPVSGWYQTCLEPYDDQIVAELDMRKESELGGLDEYGHVISYEEKWGVEQDSLLDQDTASEEGIKDEEFEITKDKIKDLRQLLTKIQGIQQRDRRRIAVNEATAEHSHSRLVLNSLIETIFFMVVTGYQVYTIRKWFSGDPTLGR